ncbi:M20 metallopeptidase family protein [Clostridium sp. DL1XJH146]
MYKDLIMEKATEIKDELISIRRDIHAHPEVGLQEIRTTGILAEKLEKLGLDVRTNVGVTGIVATLKGDYPGKTILMRADMDCLEMTELNDVEYKSQNPGKMHACGHDAHTTWLLGSAMILSQMKDKLHGNVKFCFQPAEETAGGADRMIKDGALENPKVDAAIGAHVWPTIAAGKIGVKSGSLMAAPDMFTLKILGKGGHAAIPNISIDPIAIASEIYTAFQTIISRKSDPLEPVVLSVTMFNAGTAHNIIPDEAQLSGSVRTLTNEMREWVPKKMEQIVKGITEAHGATYEFNYTPYYPPVINDVEMTNLVRESSIELLGEDNVVEIPKPTMGGEDFSYFAQKVPATFFQVGTYNEEKNAIYSLHNPHFNIDEDILYKASAVMSIAAVNYLSK